MRVAPVVTAGGSSLLRSLRHLREQLTQLRTLGVLPLVVVESPAGSQADDDAILVALQTLCGESVSPSFVNGMVDPGLGVTVSIHMPARGALLWSRFRTVGHAAHRVASRHLVELRLLDVTQAVAGSWIVHVARTLERLEPIDPCPVRLHGETASRWTIAGRFLVNEPALQNPSALVAKLCVDVSPHRYLLLDDAVEASVAVLDLLVDRLEAAASPTPPMTTPVAVVEHRVEPGRKGEKPRKPQLGPPGRPPKPAGALKKAEAAWWRDHVHLEPDISDRWNSDRLAQLFDLMMDEGFEITLRQLGAEELPEWWPFHDGRRKAAVQFREQWKTTTRKTWVKYVQRFDNDAARGRQIITRHHQGNVEPPTKPEPAKKISTIQAAVRAFEDAADIATDLLHASGTQRGKLLNSLRQTLARTGLTGADADAILDLEPAVMVEEFNRRRRLVEQSRAGTKAR